MLRTMETKDTSIQQGVTRIRSLNWPVLLETQMELEELIQQDIHTSSYTSKDSWKHSIPRLPEVMDYPKCNNADTDWCMRMPTNTSPVDFNVEICYLSCARKEIQFWNQPFTWQINSFQIKMGSYYGVIRVIPFLLSRLNMH